MSPQCAHTHTHTGHQPIVAAEQLGYFGFYVKPIDSRSMALCKRYNNSVSAHMKDNMAEESALSMTRLYTLTCTSNITLDILNAFKVITQSVNTFFPLVFVLVIHVWML